MYVLITKRLTNYCDSEKLLFYYERRRMFPRLARRYLQKLVKVVHRFLPARATRPPFTPLVEYRFPFVVAARLFRVVALLKFHPTSYSFTGLFAVRIHRARPRRLFFESLPPLFYSPLFLLFVLSRLFRVVFARETVQTSRTFFARVGVVLLFYFFSLFALFDRCRRRRRRFLPRVRIFRATPANLQKLVEIFASFIAARPTLFAVLKHRRLGVVHALGVVGREAVAADALTPDYWEV